MLSFKGITREKGERNKSEDECVSTKERKRYKLLYSK